MKLNTIDYVLKTVNLAGSKFQALCTARALIIAASDGRVNKTDRGCYGRIPSIIEMGSDFSHDRMEARLVGLAELYPDLVQVAVTHDLDTFRVESFGQLVQDIRLDQRIS